MPLYEYKCDNCGDVFEVIQRFSDTPLTVHEKCGGPVHRLLSAPALQFKGSGWYITDYARSGSASDKNGAGKTEDGGSKTASETKTETKPDSSKPSSSTTKLSDS